MSGYFFASQNTTTTDTSRGLLIRLHRDEAQHYIASDVVGLRFGYGATVDQALHEWWSQVSDILAMKDDELGDPLLSEVRAYRQALVGVPAQEDKP